MIGKAARGGHGGPPVQRVVLFLAQLLFVLPAILPLSNPSASGQGRPVRGGQANDGESQGLVFHLTEGRETQDRRPQLPEAPSTRLSDPEIGNILKRLQPIKTDPADDQEFAFPPRSLPPPRTGKTVAETFPPPDGPVTPDRPNVGPLDLVRYMPEGDVPLAPHLSVTFSQPMVPVTSHAELATQAVPVKLTPEPPGKWRWIGTRTVLFEPEGRFPMATEYSAEVPAGTQSALGVRLNTSKRWTFTTPPPKIERSFPNHGPHRLDPIIFVEFDQRINASDVLERITVQANDARPRIRLATSEEIAADDAIRGFSTYAKENRWLAFRTIEPLPPDTTVTVIVGPGTPSAEGPRKTTAPQQFTFRTFGPLRVSNHQCGWRESCSPFDQWTINFTNPLDPYGFQSAQVQVDPKVPGHKTEVSGETIVLRGVKPGSTTYRVTLDSSLKDIFGQTLGRSVTLTFEVKSAPPSLGAAGGPLVVLDPYGPAKFPVYSVNYQKLGVSLYSVVPEHWTQYREYLNSTQTADSSRWLDPPGTLVSSSTIQVKAQPDEFVETPIDLSAALSGKVGHVVAIVEPVSAPSPDPIVIRPRPNIVQAWIQATQIGIDAFVDHEELVGWATSLKDGSPIEGATLSIEPASATASTGRDGVARLPLSERQTGATVLVARKGNDAAILPENASYWATTTSWHRRKPVDSLCWYVFDDRKIYRPGEEVHIKGWIRKVGGGKRGDVGLLDGAVRDVSYSLTDARDNEISKGVLRLNTLGGFDTTFKLPPAMNLGYAHLTLTAQGGDVTVGERELVHSIQVQEFRRPEFEVTVLANEGPHFVGGRAEATVLAAYYAGGGLANSEVTWAVTSTPARYTPPNRDRFTFGKWVPWWLPTTWSEPRMKSFEGRTDPTGKHRLRIDFDSVNPPQPATVTAHAVVMDVNRQSSGHSAAMLVHPSELYVGLRSNRMFVQRGEPFLIEAIVTDLDGKPISGREIRMRSVMLDWVYEKGEWRQKEINPQECRVKSASEPVQCRFETKDGGTYQVTATVIDDRERPNESELTLWVAGGKRPPKRNVEIEEAELIPDRKEYKPGDTAEILVQAPFYPAEGIVTLRRSGIVRTNRFKMDGPSYTLKVPIEEAHIPNVHLKVDLVGATARTDDEGKPNESLPKRPAFASGELNLQVPAISRKLVVTATPRDHKLEPGGETVVNIDVKDAAGKAIRGGEIAVVVVDEAVHALTEYRLLDPIAVFYAEKDAEVSDYYLRSNILLASPAEVNKTGTMRNGGGGGGDRLALAAKRIQEPSSAQTETVTVSASASTIEVRLDFNPLAVFAPSVPTDSNGHAEVKVKLPDNLTRYRVMAVAVAGGKQFGYGESTITARLPLMARPSAPRFLNFGDRFELPVVLQNQTDAPMDVNIAVRASNAALTDGAGRRVTVPANDRVEVRFPTTTVRPGIARFQIAAVSGRWSDAAEIELPVWTPATTEAFATYGEIDSGAIAQPIKEPPDVIQQFGGLEITTSSTQLQALTDAVLYLVSYPFECSEQLASRVLAVAALRDVLAAFEAKGLPPPNEIVAAVDRDLKRLQAIQNEDGGFAFWRRGDESWPYVGIHVAHALQRAKEKGFEVPEEMLDQSREYLKRIEQHIPRHYGPETRRALVAYSLYVRARLGDRDTAKARRLIAEAGLDGLSLEAVGWLLSVLTSDPASQAEVAAIRGLLNNRATATAATAHFTTSYTDGGYLLLHSNRRADGVILESLIADQPNSDLIPKIVRGLLAHRKQGRWENTQENAFVLLALDRYFATYEKVTPEFVARAWLGDRFAGEHQFVGRTTDRYRISVPMKYLTEGPATQNLILSKNGPGRLYYRIGMQYAPASLKLDPAAYGFTVQRIYEAIDDPSDVRRDADGTWRIKSGSRVRVRLTMVTLARRYHVALVDPLPAGLEVMNPALTITGELPHDPADQQPGDWWWWRRPWFEHQNLRDERAEAFASLLWEGVHTYTYVARATTPGVFVVPPPKAEEMYHPETFGRGSTDRVVVK